jgi:hypothetical protein
MRIGATTAVAALCFSLVGLAADPLEVDPAHHNEGENEHVRGLGITETRASNR